MEFIRNVPIFSDIESAELAKIVRVGVRKKYKKGSIILLEEETGAALFVIISGKVKIVRTDDDGREVILSILGENDFFGEMSILDGLSRSASVVAITKAELFMIHRRDFLKLLQDVPSVAVSLLKELTMRLRKADSQIKSLSLKDAAGRVANVILQLADDIGTRFFVESVVRAARQLDVPVIAQSVEDESTLAALRALGFGGYQGFAGGRPSPWLPE